MLPALGYGSIQIPEILQAGIPPAKTEESVIPVEQLVSNFNPKENVNEDEKFPSLSSALMLIALGLLAVLSAHASTTPAATTGTTKATLSDGAVIWCWGSPSSNPYPSISGYPADTTPDGQGGNPGNLPPEWQGNGILNNPEPATTTNKANANDLGQTAETYPATNGVDINDVYAIQINYWNSVVTGVKPGVPEYPAGTTTPGALGYSTGSSCILYYPGAGNSNGANQGQFEITYPAPPSQSNPNEALSTSNSALYNAFPLNGNAPYSLSITDGGPTGYVSTWKGCSWDANSCTTGSQVVPSSGAVPIYTDWNAFPEYLKNVTSIPTSWSIAYDSTYGDPDTLDYPTGKNPQHPVWDASYDIWFDKTGQTEIGNAPYANGTARGQNDGLEIMVWMNSKNSYVDTVVGGVPVTGNTENYPVPNISGFAQPSGWPREQVLINGVVYDVWTSRLNNPYYGYTTASNPNAASQPNYTVVKGGAEPYNCPTLPLYNPNVGTAATSATNVTNTNSYVCGTDWNVVSFVATQYLPAGGGPLVDSRAMSMSMDTKVFTDYILGLNDGLWSAVTPPQGVDTGSRLNGVLQCPSSSMSNQSAHPLSSGSIATGDCLSPNWVFTSVQAGFEPWSGGNGLESKSFQAHVLTAQTAIQTGLTTNQGQNPNEPVVNWQTPFQVVYPGCTSSTSPIVYSAPTSVTYTITGYPNGDTSKPIITVGPNSMTAVPNTTAFEGIDTVPLYPMHSDATVTFNAVCSGGNQTPTSVFWIDPSGKIFYSDGKTPAPGATVTLLTAGSPSGPFEAVPNANYGLGTDIMDPDDNTLNPTVTGQYGIYAWDVLPGYYYEITATKAGCGTVTSAPQYVTSTPITNLFLDLPCAPPSPPALLPVGGSCHVTYNVENAQPVYTNGLTVNINIQNTGSKTIYPWTLSWTFPGNQKINNTWNVNESQSGKNVTMSSVASWESIPAGSTLSGAIGFNATYTGTNSIPTAFTLNGVPCN